MPILNLPGAEQYVLQSSLNAMADEAYTNAKRINTSGIIGGATGIDVNTEMVTTSEIRITALIDEAYADLAVRKLHETFFD